MNDYLKGVLFTLLYGLSVAVGNVLSKYLLNDVSVFTLAFPVFLFTSVFFVFMHFISNAKWVMSFSYEAVCKIIKLNIYTAGCWLLTFLCLKNLTPALFVILFFLGLSLFGVVFSENKNKFNFLAIFIIFLLILSSFYIEYSLIGYKALLFGSLSVLASFFSFLLMKETKRLYNIGASVNFVLSVRYVFALILSALISDFNQISLIVTELGVEIIFIFAVIISVVPMYFISKSLTYIDESAAANIIALTPVITYFIQFVALDGYRVNYLICLVAMVSSFTLITIEVINRKHRSQKVQSGLSDAI